MVAAMPPNMAVYLMMVGRLRNRVSTVADTERPCGAAPFRSVKMPTTVGRRFGSANPVRSSLPSVPVSPTNVANVPFLSEMISMREQPGLPMAFSRGTLAITTLRSVMSTRLLDTLTSRPFSAACLPPLGTVPNTSPPDGGSVRSTSHGIVAFMVTGVCEISGAVTLPNWPCCGQFSCAVVCTTGSSGVSADSTKPIRPATIATHRVTLTCCAFIPVPVIGRP
ncbi:Uncharacterised protein [Mycobacteroides abscessus subsp. abscessus]|nr:Uncharacterised protein [Mycobacteroides abscessus subsp. abscessus]